LGTVLQQFKRDFWSSSNRDGSCYTATWVNYSWVVATNEAGWVSVFATTARIAANGALSDFLSDCARTPA
jgi:hypothetical protein